MYGMKRMRNVFVVTLFFVMIRRHIILESNRLEKRDLGDFTEDDKIVNKFEEILRHNNVSDKENAFNRLIALFICKLVDEIQKSDNDIVDFQYKVGTDTYESLQDRLQSLHAEGMKKIYA